MQDDVDGTRQQWRVPLCADLAQTTQELTDTITTTNERLRLAHAMALTRAFVPPLPPSHDHDCR